MFEFRKPLKYKAAAFDSDELEPKYVLTADELGNDKTDPIGTRVEFDNSKPCITRPEPPALMTLGVTVTMADAGMVICCSSLAHHCG
jgi:hypothetical protein